MHSVGAAGIIAVSCRRHLSLSVGVGSPEMINFETSPEQYKHWKLSVDGAVATLSMDVQEDETLGDRKSTRLNSSHDQISYAVFCLKKKKTNNTRTATVITCARGM